MKPSWTIIVRWQLDGHGWPFMNKSMQIQSMTGAAIGRNECSRRCWTHVQSVNDSSVHPLPLCKHICCMTKSLYGFESKQSEPSIDSDAIIFGPSAPVKVALKRFFGNNSRINSSFFSFFIFYLQHFTNVLKISFSTRYYIYIILNFNQVSIFQPQSLI